MSPTALSKKQNDTCGCVLAGVLVAAQQRGPPGLLEPPTRRRGGVDAAGCGVGRAGCGLPVWALRAHGGTNPRHGPATGRAAYRRQPGLLAPHAQGGILEPDEAHRAQRGNLRRSAHPGDGCLGNHPLGGEKNCPHAVPEAFWCSRG